MTHFKHKPTVMALAVMAALPAFAQSEQKGSIQEVVVTAQKTTTVASKTPLALSVISGDDLKSEGAATTLRLADLVPNLSIGTGNLGGTEIAIRGIGSTNNSEVGDPAVGVNIDGIYLGRPQMNGATLFDVERIEVLRGPQGTLYGRNSNAGAVNIISKKPGKKFEGSVGLGFSNLSGVQADAMLNVPVSSTFSLRGVLSSAKRDGFIDTAHAPANTFSKDRNDVDNVSARLHGLWTITPSTSLLLTGYYGKNGGAGAGSVDYAVVAAHPKGPDGRFVATSAYEGKLRDESKGATAEFKTQTALGEVTVLANHQNQDRDSVFTVSTRPTGFYSFARYAQDSLEARIASTGTGPLQYVAGLYNFKENISPVVLGALSGAFFYQDPTISKSQAAFGQLSYAVAPSLKVTGGLRSTQDDKSRQGCTYTFAALNAAGLTDYTNPASLPATYPAKASMPACTGANGTTINDAAVHYNKSTYKVGMEWEPSRTELLYASVSSGFKAGGFNDGSASTRGSALTYNPESITATEAGLKGRYLDGKLQVNAALFSYRYVDLQVSAVTACPTGSCLVTQNAAQATSQGLELEGKYQLGANGRLNVAFTHVDAKYARFAAAASVANPAGVDWSGRRLDKAPTQTLNLGYTHYFTLESGANLSAYAGTKFSSRYYLSNPATATQFYQPSYNKSDAHLTYASADDRYEVQVFVRNIEDRNVMTNYQASGGKDAMYLAEPRIFGVRGTFRF